jgi:D-amino-acid dehydrogenase
MRVAIIGAGIAGVCTAYELAADGHQVSVFERRGSVAAESSFANAGQVVPGLAQPWLTPRLPGPGAGFGRRWRSWQATRGSALVDCQDRLLQLAAYSHRRLQQLRRSLQLEHERADGLLVLLRSARDLAAVAPRLEQLQRLGIALRQLDADQCRAVEPGLNAQTSLHGGVQLLQAEVGNCRQFAHLLRVEAQRLGVQFRFHTTVRKIEAGKPLTLQHEYTPPTDGAENGGRSREDGDTQPMPLGPQQDSFDALIVCAALDSAALLKPLGLKLPLELVQTCSITAPLRQLEAHPDFGPRAGLLDQQHQVAISRIGQRVRVSGGDIASDEGLLHQVLHDWFPGAMQSGQLQRWNGTYAVLPDGLPLLGASGRPGIWLNLAHPDAGWTLACGAARALAESLAGLQPEVDLGGLDATRLA